MLAMHKTCGHIDMLEKCITFFLFFFITGTNVDAGENEINKKGNENVMALIDNYKMEGFSCNDITGREAKVLERIEREVVPSNYKIYLCSKKELGFISAKRKNVVIIANEKNIVEHVDYFSDQIHM
jgi:hypothetical protein